MQRSNWDIYGFSVEWDATNIDLFRNVRQSHVDSLDLNSIVFVIYEWFKSLTNNAL